MMMRQLMTALLAAMFAALTTIQARAQDQDTLKKYQQWKAQGLSDQEIQAKMLQEYQQKAADPNSAEAQQQGSAMSQMMGAQKQIMEGARTNKGPFAVIKGAMQGQLAFIPNGAIAKAKPGKTIGLKVDFEAGDLLLPMRPERAPATIKSSIRKVKTRGGGTEYRYSIGGEAPTVTWNSGVAGQHLFIVRGTYEHYKNFVTGEGSPEEMEAAQKQNPVASIAFATPLAYDEAGWNARNEKIQDVLNQLNEMRKKNRKPPIVANLVNFAERNKDLMRYGFPTPFKAGDRGFDVISYKEQTDLSLSYGITLGLGEAGGVIEPGQTCTAILVALKKPILPSDGRSDDAGRMMAVDSEQKAERAKATLLGNPRLSDEVVYGNVKILGETGGTAVSRMDPDQQARHYEAYYTEFQVP